MRINSLRLIAALAMMFAGSIASAQVSVGGVGVGGGAAGGVGAGVVGPGVGGAGSAAGAVGGAPGVTGAAAGQAGAGTVNAAGAATGSAQRGNVGAAGNAAGQAGQTGVSAAGNAAGQVGRGTANAGTNAATQAGNGIVNGSGNAAGNAAGAVNRTGVNGAVNAAGAAAGQAGNVNAGAAGAADAAAGATRSLGVNVREAQNGLTISNLNAGSLAERAGLRNGDRIVSLDGKPLRSHQELVNAIRSGTAQTGNLTIVRNGVTQQIPLNWGTATAQVQGAANQAQQVTAGFRGLNDGITFNTVGNALQVGQVTNGSWAHSSGLMANDRIVALNGIPVTSQNQLMTALQNAASQNGTAQMIVNRAGQQQTLQLRIPRDSLNGSLGNTLNNTGNFLQNYDRFAGDFRTAINDAKGNTRDELNAINTRITNLRAEYGNIRGQGPQADQFRNQLQTLRGDMSRIANSATDQQLRTRINELNDQLNGLRPDFGDGSAIGGSVNGTADGAASGTVNSAAGQVNAAGNAAAEGAGSAKSNVPNVTVPSVNK